MESVDSIDTALKSPSRSTTNKKLGNGDALKSRKELDDDVASLRSTTDSVTTQNENLDEEETV